MTTYAERLWPPVWLWVVGWLFVLSLALAFYAALGAPGLLLGVVLGAVLTWGLIAAAAPVGVQDGLLTAGSAVIPIALLGQVEVLDSDQARAVRGPDSDPTGYHLIRGWVAEGVRVPVEDPKDPTPYWFIASRHPAALAAAIEGSRTG